MAIIWDETNPAFEADLISQIVRNMWESIQAERKINLLEDPKFEIWPFGVNGASHRPAYWGGFTSPTNYLKATSGIGEQSNNVCRITVDSVGRRLGQIVLAAGEFPDELRGSGDQGFFGIGAFVKSASSAARLSVYDGVGRSILSNTHSGGDTFEWLSGAGQISNVATQLRWDFEPLAASGNHDITDCVMIHSPIPPDRFHVPNSGMFTIDSVIKEGLYSSAQEWFYFSYHRPFIFRGATYQSRIAPTGSSVIADIDVKRTGAAWQSIFLSGSRPTIAVGAQIGSGKTDTATYFHRCVNHYHPSAVIAQDAQCRFVTDQADSGATAQDLFGLAHCWKTESPLEFYREFDHVWQ